MCAFQDRRARYCRHVAGCQAPPASFPALAPSPRSPPMPPSSVGSGAALLRTEPAARPIYRAYTQRNLSEIPQLRGWPEADLLIMRAVAAVLPFRTNAYVVDQLIDWSDIEHDPIYRLTFPSAAMLDHDDLTRMVKLVKDNAPPAAVAAEAHDIRQRLNPHPGGQLQLNIPHAGEERLRGLQHKYQETVLVFPSPGQTCHAYCTYCFRWAQFVGEPDLKMACGDPSVLLDYVRAHPEVTDVLITG